jgi:hypothetical protein
VLVRPVQHIHITILVLLHRSATYLQGNAVVDEAQNRVLCFVERTGRFRDGVVYFQIHAVERNLHTGKAVLRLTS